MAKLLQLARPQFLIASVVLFSMGASLAIMLGSSFSPLRVLLGYLIILPAHLSVFYCNDYFDVEADKHAKPSLFSGGSGNLVRLYMPLTESINKPAVEALKETADEELVHVGEFRRLLRELAPHEEKLYCKGDKVEEKKLEKESGISKQIHPNYHQWMAWSHFASPTKRSSI